MLTLPTPLEAQYATTARSAAARIPSASPSLTASVPADSSSDRANVHAVRIALGALAFWPGAFIGAHIGAASAGPCGCDDPGLMEALIGAWVGGALASGLASSLITSHDRARCSTFERVASGSVGAGLGVLLGIVVAASTDGETAVVSIPLGAGAGAALMMKEC